MVLYRRNFLPGGTYFFTVALFDRRSTILIENVGALRDAFRAARRERPFEVDAIVILPDHLHVVMSLPPHDADFAGRWRRIKGHFSSALLHAGIDVARHSNGELAL
jgi:putative transposase